MRALLRTRWFNVAVLLTTLTVLIGAAVLAGEARLRFFMEAPLETFPFILLFPFWGLALSAMCLFSPKARRVRTQFAGLAMVMFSLFIIQLDTVTLFGLVQALGLGVLVTWLGVGRFPDTNPPDGSGQP